jgi:hypothetical protein
MTEEQQAIDQIEETVSPPVVRKPPFYESFRLDLEADGNVASYYILCESYVSMRNVTEQMFSNVLKVEWQGSVPLAKAQSPEYDAYESPLGTLNIRNTSMECFSKPTKTP